MAVNQDFKDLVKTFNDCHVEQLVIGAHAVMFYARPRFAKDLDEWVNPTPENAQRVSQALMAFGVPLAVPKTCWTSPNWRISIDEPHFTSSF
jgi:hypothetical protein